MFDMILPFDQQITILVNQTLANPFFDRLFMFLTNKNMTVLPVIFVMAWIWWKGTLEHRAAIVLSLFAIIFGDLIGEQLKQLCARPRPYLNPSLIDNLRVLGGESSNSPSFPSNHAVNSWALAIPLIVFCRRQFKWLTVFFTLFAIAICYSRIYVGVHYLSDVIAGAFIGCVTGLAMCYLHIRWPLCKNSRETGQVEWGWTGMAILLGILLTGVRFSFLMDANIDLSFEEAQYWDWSRRLDWGYFSKPPMIAWIIHFFTQIVGNSTPFWVRFPSTFFALILLIALWRFTAMLGGNRQTRFWAVLTASTMPLFAAGSVLITTDTPLILWWMFALISLWLALHTEALKYWIVCGLFVGLGLLSKYSMFYFHACLFVMLIFTPKLRNQLRNKGVWIATGISLLMLAPPMLWNYANDWVSFRHVAADATDRGSAGLNPLFFFDFIGSQAGVAGIGIFFGGLWLAWKRRKQITPAQKFLLWFSLPIILGFALKSFTSKVQGNWIAMVYPALTLFAVLTWTDWRCQLPKTDRVYKRLTLLGIATILLGLPTTLAVYYPLACFEKAGENLMQTEEQLEQDFGQNNKVAYQIGRSVQSLAKPLLCWAEAGRLTSIIRKEMPDPDNTFILTTSYHWAAEMAFYVDGQPHAMVCEGTRKSQYDIWDEIHSHLGNDAVLVTERPLTSLMPETLSAFAHVEAIGPIVLSFKDFPVRTLYIYKCYNLLQIPQAVQESY